jgi:hypothetical protein
VIVGADVGKAGGIVQMHFVLALLHFVLQDNYLILDGLFVFEVLEENIIHIRVGVFYE